MIIAAPPTIGGTLCEVGSVAWTFRVAKRHDVLGVVGRELRNRQGQHSEQGDNHTDDYYWLHIDFDSADSGVAGDSLIA